MIMTYRIGLIIGIGTFIGLLFALPASTLNPWKGAFWGGFITLFLVCLALFKGAIWGALITLLFLTIILFIKHS
jgi:hypothetical protein